MRLKARSRSPLRGRLGRAWAVALSAGLAVLGPLASVHAEDAPTLTGGAAWARIVGNTVEGTTPDGPFSELFAAEGGLTIVDRDGKAGGRWELKGDLICTKVDDDEEECRTLEVKGSTGAFVDGGDRYPFTILPGNPKGL